MKHKFHLNTRVLFKHLIIILVVTGCLFGLNAQHVSAQSSGIVLTGTVTDRANGQPIAGATVIFDK